MEPYYSDEFVTLFHGDCLDVLRGLPDASVDAVVTDPPYGLGFMGKEWDGLPPGEPWARECLRVLKPGGHLLAFGGTRTWHRLAVAVEDAGFEVRDSIAWLYGSGFPKSLDVSKAIDKANGKHDRDLSAFGAYVRERRVAKGWTLNRLDQEMGTNTAASWWEGRKSGVQPPSLETYGRLKAALDMDDTFDSLIEWVEAEREVVGKAYRLDRKQGHVNYGGGTPEGHYDITAPATPDAERWQGWGTALKPAFEPIVVARKPPVGTVAANVLAHGTGALNIAACRVAHASEADLRESANKNRHADFGSGPRENKVYGADNRARGENGNYDGSKGRWPANVILDESQAAVLDEQSGVQRDGVAINRNRSGQKPNEVYGTFAESHGDDVGYGGNGGASRFMYVAKADASERVRVNGTAHPTVKPLALMRWLVRLVTPPGGTVLEPFAGSGTTVEACLLEGFRCIAIEREADYLPLIRQRIARRRNPVEAVKNAGEEGGLFDLLGEETTT